MGIDFSVLLFQQLICVIIEIAKSYYQQHNFYVQAKPFIILA